MSKMILAYAVEQFNVGGVDPHIVPCSEIYGSRDKAEALRSALAVNARAHGFKTEYTVNEILIKDTQEFHG